MSDESELKLIVGFGASAGGLAVFKKLVKTLPYRIGMAFFIVQHLDPKHKSMLGEILARQTDLPVREAVHDEKILPDRVYIGPPGSYMEVKDAKISIVQPEVIGGASRAIDHFFTSLANSYGSRSVGVIFSGSGSDGAEGLRAIHAAGGLTLVQDPETAEHSNMPSSAVKAGVVHKIIQIEEFPEIIEQYTTQPMTLKQPDKQIDNTVGSLHHIAEILKKYKSFNLQQYKPSTVQRRVIRRMSLTGLTGNEEYVALLQQSEEERDQLTKDLLINVTEFFRDQEAFELLATKVIPDILHRIDEQEDIRIWVAGCATGEEAYTLAMLFLEAVAQSGSEHEIKIFATDIDAEAIEIARKGIYPEQVVTNIPTKYLEKYFTKIEHDDWYRINSQVRDVISFANQNVVNHPPFSHMHLITCRNLLIYLQKETQEKVLSSFYFSLEGESYLFLGSSESIGNMSSFFRSTSKKWRIYRKIPGHDQHRTFLQSFFAEGRTLSLAESDSFTGLSKKEKKKVSTRTDQIKDTILNNVVPPLIVVDSEGKIRYNHGELRPYLTVPSGEPRIDVVQLVVPALRSRLRSALYKVTKSNKKVVFHSVMPEGYLGGDTKRRVRVELVPLIGQNFIEGQAIGIVFNAGEELTNDEQASLTKDDESKFSQNLEQELAETKEELQNTIEELETSSEELKAVHEEALSTNEELQSANEELEASSEELRSLNEELSTVNVQLKEKITLLQKANNDLENFFASTNIPTIFLNPQLEIQRYTPSSEQLLKIGPLDIGRPIYSLGRDLVDSELKAECEKVLQTFQPIIKEKQLIDGRWYLLQIMPYRTHDRHIEGIVLVFQEITEIKKLSKRAEARERQHSVVANIGMLALSGIDPMELIRQAVRQVAHVLDADFCKVLKYLPEEDELLLIAGIGWQDGLVGNHKISGSQSSQSGYTLLSQEPIIVKDLGKEKRFVGSELLTDHGVVSGISCPINHTSPPFGVLSVHTKELREFSEDDANFLVSVANMLSTAIRTKEDQEKLHQSESRFRNLANSLPQLAWMAEASGNIIWYNQRWYDYTGTNLEQVSGWGWKRCHHPDHVARVAKKFAKHIEKGKEWEDTFPLLGADGIYRWFLSRAKPVRDKEGKIIRWFGSNTDITEQLELESSLKNVVNELEDADRRKNEFLAILGHELRNPLGALKGSLEIIEQDVSEPHEVTTIMQRSVDTMAKLLDDLLDLTRITRNTISLELEELDLEEVLRRSLITLRKQCEGKNQRLETDISKELIVKGDLTRIEQILSNLVSNASKYTPSGGTIHVSAKRLASEVVVKVTDNGIGLDADALNKVFDPFYQVAPDGKASSGLGIGLSLVKKLVELHNGSITVESRGKGEGAVFEVRLPVAKEHRMLKPAENVSNEGIPPGLKVALIDDNPDILMILSKVLEKLHCQVFVANNGVDALTLIKREYPDASFIDIGLPDMTGHEVAAKLREEGFSNLLIAASGYSHDEARKKSTVSGFDYHLAKPLSRKDIIRLLSEALSERT